MQILDIISGFNELFNHVNLGKNSLLVAGSTRCCATGTCDGPSIPRPNAPGTPIIR